MKLVHHPRPGVSERGQIIVLFVISVFVIVGVVGLVIDGGGAFAQRRVQQNVVDMAALAGANTYLNTAGTADVKAAAAEAAARATAAANGAVHGVDSTSLGVNVTGDTNLGTVEVGMTRPHRNAFVGLFGWSTWDVSVDAQARSARKANAAKGVLPLLFNEAAYKTNPICDTSASSCTDKIVTFQLPGTGTEDVPQDATTFNWTVFCTASGNECNGDQRVVNDLIEQNGTATTIGVNTTRIGPLNSGAITALFNDLERYALNTTFPVPIVNDDGVLLGIAYFKLISIEGNNDKVIKGYFVSPFDGVELEYIPGGGEAALDTGAYIAAELTD